MDSQRFDSIARLLAARRTRRDALRAGGAGLAAGALAAVQPHRSRAQSATPEATETLDLLFVQTFASGALTPDGADGYTLTLTGEQGPTIYFADRPDRLWGTMTTERFFTGPVSPFDPANPPNAALLTSSDQGHGITVISLADPAFDPATRTATYHVQIIPAGDDENLSALAAGPALDPPAETFAGATLFIDNAQGIFDCPASHAVECHANQELIGTLDVPYCGTGSGTWCEPCVLKNDPSGSQGAAECNAAFAACNGQCTMYPAQCLWPC